MADPKSARSGRMSVDDILLDTGCSQTMVHRELMNVERILDGPSGVLMVMCSW